MAPFASNPALFARYRGEIRFRDKVMGGVPNDPGMIEGWLRSKAGISQEEEIKTLVQRTMIERGTWSEDMTPEQVEEASKAVASMRETSGFKRDTEGGVFLEQRQLKAAIKESTNILFAPEKWGPTRKGPKQFLAERVFVSPDKLYLGRDKEDGVERFIGHIVGPQGPRSTLGYHEFVSQARFEFDVLVVRDSIKPEWWVDIWTHMQENGLGAMRSQGYGRFDLLGWEQIPAGSSSPLNRPFQKD